LDRIRTECARDGFDIIIDDASHIGELTRKSFWHLFENHLKPGGLFVIEDWGTGYWDSWVDGKHYNNKKHHLAGMVGLVKELVDECGIEDITDPQRGVPPRKGSRFEFMQIYSGQVFIKKKEEKNDVFSIKDKEFCDEVSKRSTDLVIIAIIAAHNEDDIIYHVIGDLIKQGIQVYLIDHCSTDNTIQEASKWLNKGLIHIENFPEDAGYSKRNKTKYIWSDILRRKEELALDLDADWFIHHDADEFRESPWVGLSLCEAIETVDKMGYNAIDFELFNFRPVDNKFVPGEDARQYLKYYDAGGEFDKIQIKAWKKQNNKIDLVSSGGHEVKFEDRKVVPVKFILRHYPIRSERHGIRKVIKERKPRYAEEERNTNWHVQYDSVNDEDHIFLSDPSKLNLYDDKEVRLRLLSVPYHSVLPGLLSEERRAKDDLIQNLENMLKNREEVLNSIYASRGWKLLKTYYNIRDSVLRRTKK
jgi:glycosyltransferase involved in cell wall biosynthesis